MWIMKISYVSNLLFNDEVAHIEFNSKEEALEKYECLSVKFPSFEIQIFKMESINIPTNIEQRVETTKRENYAMQKYMIENDFSEYSIVDLAEGITRNFICER